MIFKKVIPLLIMVLSPCLILGSNAKYKVSDIPLTLKENAKAIVRYENIDFEVFSTKKAVLKSTCAITILNKNGLRQSVFLQFYDKFSKLSKIKATIYDANGVVVKKIMPDEIIDHSAIQGFSLYEDNRLNFIDPKYRTFPFTVEYSYEKEFFGFLDFPDWSPYRDFNISVQESNFRVTVPENYRFRYLESNMDHICTLQENEDKFIYSWQLKNLKSEIEEDFSFPIREYFPIVYAAPSDIEFDGYPGNFDSWWDFGKWIGTLNNGRDNLDEGTRKYIIDLVKDSINEVGKIKALYEFLQNKTRYVSIQIGIGGWQPMEAGTVDKYSYGDCKALSNYMKSILKVAGINSFYTLIYAGDEAAKCITGFPSNQFNHAILCVPIKNDTIWLECTSQHIPFGYLGTFTDDREALMITDSGGVLIHTPVLSKNENLKLTTATIRISDDGVTSESDISIKYSGMFYDKMQHFFHSDNSDQKLFIEKHIERPWTKVSQYTLSENKSKNPALNFDISLNIDRDLRLQNDRLIVPLDLLTKSPDIPSISNERKSNLLIRRSYQLIDTIVFIIPQDFHVGQLPAEKSENLSFGNFSTRFIQSGNSLYYIRRVEMIKGSYPALDYGNFIAFFEDIEKSDCENFILTK